MPGLTESCQGQCALVSSHKLCLTSTVCKHSLNVAVIGTDLISQVLLKGVYARRVPITVEASVDTSVDASILRIDDQFLVLDSRYPWQNISSVPDLSVVGGAITVNLQYARIGRLLVNSSGAGRWASSFIRCAE